jgi:membrane-associated protein
MSSLLHSLLGLPTPLAYALVGGLAFGESVFLLGFVLPGEAAVLLGGVLASQGRASLTAMIAVAAVGAVLGDSVGFEIGRRVGPAFLARPHVARHRSHVARVEALMRRRGAWAVILGRFTAYLRPVVPAVAGTSGMAYPRFLAANTVGGLAWAAAVTVAGFELGDTYERVVGISRWAGLAMVAVLAAVAMLAWLRRRSHQGDFHQPPEPVDAAGTRPFHHQPEHPAKPGVGVGRRRLSVQGVQSTRTGPSTNSHPAPGRDRDVTAPSESFGDGAGSRQPEPDSH